MNERDACQTGDPSKNDRGKPRQCKATLMVLAPSNWPKVMMSREDRICERAEVFAEVSPSSSGQRANGQQGQQGQQEDQEEEEEEEEEENEGDCDVEHLCCNEKEERGICLISSSSEIQEDLGIEEATGVKENGLKKIEQLMKEKEKEKGKDNQQLLIVGTGKSAGEEIPIFVDLTTDEKNIWKQTILKRSSDVKPLVEENERETGIQDPTASITIDSSSRTRNARGLAIALRDCGPYLIPAQPNRSLPIRPAPLPTRSFRKNGPSLLVLSKPANLDLVDLEPVKSIDPTPDQTTIREHNQTDTSFETAETSLEGSTVFTGYSRRLESRQISIEPNLSGTKKKKKKKNDYGDREKGCAKENKRKKKSQEIHSSQGRENGFSSSMKQFLRNFCGSTDNSSTRNLCTDKCANVVSTSDCKNKCCGKLLVPPLRLKKIVRIGSDKCENSQVVAGAKHESNYKIIRAKTSRLRSSPHSTTWTSLFHEKKTNLEPSNNNRKVKYRRNRLKQKLRELRRKALDLAKVMANDTSSQQNTKMKQIMNRYEKQIENLSKLHSKLSAALPASEKADPACSSKVVEYLLVGASQDGSLRNKYPIACSPEPPKLSPRSSTSFEDIPPDEIRNSPPILPRVCLPICSSSQDEQFQVSDCESKVWSASEEPIARTISASSDRNDSLGNGLAALRGCIRAAENILNIEANDFRIEKKCSSHSDSIVQLFEDNCSEEKKDEERHEVKEEELSPGRLIIHEEENGGSIGFTDSGPVISSVISGPEAAATVSAAAGEILESATVDQASRPDPYQSGEKQTHADVNQVNRTAQNQKVTSSSNQSIQIQFEEAPTRQETIILQRRCKREKPPIDAARESSDNYTITEQFPTLGNWVAGMSKNGRAVPFNGPTENSSRISASKMQKMMVNPSVSNDILNTTLQYGADGWQFYQQQQQQRQQQLLQNVPSVTLAQPVPMVPPYRPTIYPSIPTNQYYPNNYAIDPYNSAALNYHPAVCPYNPYPYHSRLHPSSLSGYHFPMQEGLRPLQHPDKRYSHLQEPIVKYSSPVANNLQQSTVLPPDRLRAAVINGNNVGVPSLPSLFLPPTSLPSPQHPLPVPALSGYKTSNHILRSTVIPDMLAVAATAAVVAAASLDRQCDPLACNARISDLSNATVTNIIDSDSSCAGSSGKTEILHANNSSQSRDSGFSKDSNNYQRMQNYLFSRPNNFVQPNPNPNSSNESNRLQMTAIDSSSSQRIPVSQTTKTVPEHEVRNCETPHLGKVDRSSNSLYSLVCSNCGIIGPKFKCLGCEMVFYCDGRCQQKHWSLHVRRCPKKMPKLRKVS